MKFIKVNVRVISIYFLTVGLCLTLLVPARYSAGEDVSRPGEAPAPTPARVWERRIRFVPRLDEAPAPTPAGSLNESRQRPSDGEIDYFSRYLLNQAQTALASRRYDQAADFINLALAKHPQHRELLLFAAEVAGKQKKWPEAEKRFSQILALTPNDGPALAGRGLAKWQQGLMSPAAEDLSRALAGDLADEQLQGLAEKALADIQAGQPAPKASIEADQARLDEDWSLVTIMEERGDWDWLDRFYTRLLQHSPGAGSYAYASRGFARLSMGREDGAEKDFTAALSRTDLNPQTRKAVLETLDRMKARRQEAAELQTREAEKRLPDQVALSRDDLDPQSRPTIEENMPAMDSGAKAVEERAGIQAKAAGRQKAETDLKAASGSVRGQEELKPRQSGRCEAESGGDHDVWTDFAAMERHLRAGRLEALASCVDRLRSLKLKGEERGQQAYYEGELLWIGRQYDQAHKLYLEASALVSEKYRRSDILWRLAEYSRLQGDQGRAIEYAEQSAAVLPEAHWRLHSVGGLLAGYGQDLAAVGYFQRSLSLHTPGRYEVGLYQDLANTYGRLDDEKARLAYQRLYIDRATEIYAGLDDLKQAEVEDLYGARRTHSYLTRDWGLDSYIFGNSYQGSDYSVQMLNELYGNIRWNGMIFQPYLQLNGSLASSFSGTYYASWLGQDQPWSGQSHLRESLYGIAGLRVHPFPHLRHSLSFGLEQVIKIGTQTENDTRFRFNHFWHTGLDMEPYVTNWPYAIALNQATYSTRNSDLTAFGEVRAGRSLRLDALNDRLVITPHVSAVWGYGGQSIDKGQRWSLEAGPGLSLRKWYREDKYNAPQSSVDVTVQYRWGLSHERKNVLSIMLSNSF